MPDILELDDVGTRAALLDDLRHVRARDRVRHPPDEADWGCGLLHRRLPAIFVGAALRYVLDQAVVVLRPAPPYHRFPLLVQLPHRWLMGLREYLRQRLAELGLRQDLGDHKAQYRLLQQLLDSARAMEAAVDAAVEEGEVTDPRAELAL